MWCSFSLVALVLSCSIIITDAQQKIKSKVHVMEDEELASILNDMQKETAKTSTNQPLVHKKIGKIPIRRPKSRNMPFIQKPQRVVRTKEQPSKEPDRVINSKVHYMDDSELKEILNNLNAPKKSTLPALENVELNELSVDRAEPPPLEKPNPRMNIDNIPLQDYSKVYLVVDPDALKSTENQAMLTDLIGKVIAARKSQRRDGNNDDLAAQYAKLAETKDNDDGQSMPRDISIGRKGDRDRGNNKEAQSDRETLQNTLNSRTARPLSRGDLRSQRNSEEDK